MKIGPRGLTGLGALLVAALVAGTAVLVHGPQAHSEVPAAPQPVAAAPAAAPASTPAPSATPAAPADSPFVIRRVLPIEGAIRYGEWHWDETGAPAEGPIVITVDLEARVLSVFRAGYEIGATAVLLGTQEKPTPTGVFPITQKRRDHVSNLYNAPMPFMQRLTNDGISIHATNVQNGYASHGCIGTPLEFARRLFQTTTLGDRVIITRGQSAAVGSSLAS